MRAVLEDLFNEVEIGIENVEKHKQEINNARDVSTKTLENLCWLLVSVILYV